MNTLDVEVTIKPRGSRRAAPEPPTQMAAPRIPRITRLMALAIKFQGMVDCGEVRDYADLARLGYVTRARMTQIMNLLNLAPDLQAALLRTSEREEAPPRERTVRQIVAHSCWPDQRRIWEALVADRPTNRV